MPAAQEEQGVYASDGTGTLRTASILIVNLMAEIPVSVRRSPLEQIMKSVLEVSTYF